MYCRRSQICEQKQLPPGSVDIYNETFVVPVHMVCHECKRGVRRDENAERLQKRR
jgi:hypothetical protein